MTAVVLLALAGFPVVLVVAWFFDLTRHGLLRTAEAAAPSASLGLTDEITADLGRVHALPRVSVRHARAGACGLCVC
ncbi:hypothetical protein BH23GEM9_BH23GEM9_26950 [soil metagenome]